MKIFFKFVILIFLSGLTSLVTIGIMVALSTQVEYLIKGYWGTALFLFGWLIAAFIINGIPSVAGKINNKLSARVMEVSVRIKKPIPQNGFWVIINSFFIALLYTLIIWVVFVVLTNAKFSFLFPVTPFLFGAFFVRYYLLSRRVSAEKIKKIYSRASIASIIFCVPVTFYSLVAGMGLGGKISELTLVVIFYFPPLVAMLTFLILRRYV